jgi:hypothetical protein
MVAGSRVRPVDEESTDMVRTTERRGRRVMVIDFSYRRPDGTKARYRHDAEVQMRATAVAEERRRLAALAATGSPFASSTRARRGSTLCARSPRRSRRGRRSSRRLRATGRRTRRLV